MGGSDHALLAADGDGSLAGIGVGPAQALDDGQELLRLMRERQPSPAASATLAAIHHRYLGSPKPPKGGTMSLGPIGCACSAWTAGICGRA